MVTFELGYVTCSSKSQQAAGPYGMGDVLIVWSNGGSLCHDCLV